MKVLHLTIAALFLVSAAACGTTEEPKVKKETAPVADAATDNTASTPTDVDNTNNSTPSDEYARQICERINTCMGEMTCTQPAQIDVEACIGQLMTQNVDSSTASFYEGLACDEINKSQCSNNTQLQDMCECPTSPQGDCEGGLFCSVALSTSAGDTLYACGTELGGIPETLAICDQETPCPDAEMQCVTTSQGATSGSCMTMCEQ